MLSSILVGLECLQSLFHDLGSSLVILRLYGKSRYVTEICVSCQKTSTLKLNHLYVFFSIMMCLPFGLSVVLSNFLTSNFKLVKIMISMEFLLLRKNVQMLGNL